MSEYKTGQLGVLGGGMRSTEHQPVRQTQAHLTLHQAVLAQTPVITTQHGKFCVP